jgi:hypothetical protein
MQPLKVRLFILPPSTSSSGAATLIGESVASCGKKKAGKKSESARYAAVERQKEECPAEASQPSMCRIQNAVDEYYLASTQ